MPGLRIFLLLYAVLKWKSVRKILMRDGWTADGRFRCSSSDLDILLLREDMCGGENQRSSRRTKRTSPTSWFLSFFYQLLQSSGRSVDSRLNIQARLVDCVFIFPNLLPRMVEVHCRLRLAIGCVGSSCYSSIRKSKIMAWPTTSRFF